MAKKAANSIKINIPRKGNDWMLNCPAAVIKDEAVKKILPFKGLGVYNHNRGGEKMLEHIRIITEAMLRYYSSAKE